MDASSVHNFKKARKDCYGQLSDKKKNSKSIYPRYKTNFIFLDKNVLVVVQPGSLSP